MFLSEVKIIAGYSNDLKLKFVLVNINTLLMGKPLASWKFQT